MKILIVLILLSVLSKVTGLFRELSVGFIFGPGDVLDTFIIVMMIPSIILDLISVSINSCYVPLHKRFYNNNTYVLVIILCVCFTISFSLSFLVYFVNVDLIELLLDSNSINFVYVKAFSLPVSIFVFITTLSEFLKSILVCENKTTYIPVITIISNITFVIAIYFLNIEVGYLAIAYGYCLFILTQFIMSGFLSKLYVKKSFDSIDKATRKKIFFFITKYIILIIPVSFGSLTNQLNKAVDKYLASQFEPGTLSQLYFAQQLYAVLVGVLVVNVVTYYYPKICMDIKNSQSLNTTANEALYFLSFVSLLIFTSIFPFSQDLVSIFMGYGKMKGNIEEVANVFLIYSSGLFFESVSAVFKRIMWAKSDTRTPMKATILCVFVNICLSVFLSVHIGFYGIIIATVTSNILVAFILGLELRKNMDLGFNFIKWLFKDIVTIFPVLLMFGLYAKYEIVSQKYIVLVPFITCCTGFLIYLIRRYKFEK